MWTTPLDGTRWHTLGRSSSERQVPGPTLHPWHRLHGRMAENDYLVKKDGTWVMVEYCERVSEMVEPERFIEETLGRTAVVTFLTDGFEDVEAMGFGVEGGEERSMSMLESLEGESQPMLDIPEDEKLEQQELELLPEVPAGDGEVQGVGDAGQLQLQVPQEGGRDSGW